jgi:hypothetical protein
MSASPLALAAKKVIDAAWLHGDAYDLSSQAAFALESAQLLQSPETAAELERLRKQVAELEAAAYGDATVRLLNPIEQIRHLHSCVAAQMDRANTLDRLCREQRARVAELEARREALAERMRAGQTWQRGRNPELVSENQVSQSELREIFGIPLTPPWKSESTAECRCHEPDADPYACEADDCRGEFSELNPFGGGPVEGRDAKVSRTCDTCGWRTSVWHVADGSADEELHQHITRVHGGTAPLLGSNAPEGATR